MAVGYRLAKENNDPLLSELRSWVRSAKAAYNGAHKTHSIFGPRGRERSRLSQKLGRQRLWIRNRRLPVHRRAAAVAAEVGTRATLSEALSAARKQDVLEGAARRRALAEDTAVLERWSAAHEPQTLSQLQEAYPKFPWDVQRLLCLPDSVGLTVSLPAIPAPEATKALAWPAEVWLNIGHMSYSPYLPTFHKMVKVVDAEGLQPAFHDKTILKVS